MRAQLPSPRGKVINTLRSTAALFALLIGSVAAACEYPPLVTIPTGSEATLDEMLEAQTEVRTYVEAMEVYLACVAEELTAGGEDAPEEFKSIMSSRHNAAMAELEAVAALFNEQIQAYRCSSGTETGTADQSSDVNEACAPIPTEEPPD